MIIPSFGHLKQIMELNRPLTCLKGIGHRRAELLARKGLNTLLDLIFFMPIRYEDRSRVLPINETGEGLTAQVKGKVIFCREEKFFHSGKRRFRILIKDETAPLELLWFHYKSAQFGRFAQHGLELMAYGRIQKNRDKRQMIHPDITLVDREEGRGIMGFYPVYPAVKGISGNILRSAVRAALDQCQGSIVDAIPRVVTRGLALPELSEAIMCVHTPPKESSVALLNQFMTRHQKRLTFDRFFWVMFNIALRKRSREMKAGFVFSIPKGLMSMIKECFPFALTGDQVQAIKEILNDLGSGIAMSRLLQGDVGCGKTVVAAAAAFVTILNGCQVAVMVPTQVLARQHYSYFSSLSESMGFRPVLLTGAQKEPDRLRACEKISDGKYNLIIGTQTLIREDLSYAKLSLVVIDEQHRFGVRQRALLDRKGTNPHQLVMTATPIPRTLAMTVYADLNISVIKEYPEGHRPVKTCLVNERDKKKVYYTLKQRMSVGQQAMVICPVIEGSEEADLKNALEMYARLRRIFAPRFRVGLIHGRLSPDEKDRVMAQFRDGQVHVLVGTTVIEVGVHAPGATVIVIEHPERFGLAQLHQLRGRVGRGSDRGLCLLMLSKGLPEETISRLNLLVESHDGFEIARKDLEMRGQGELMGIRQAGAGELDFKEMLREPELLMTAKRQAEKILESDPELSRPENHRLREMVGSSWDTPLDS